MQKEATMNKVIVAFAVFSSILLSSCAGNSVAMDTDYSSSPCCTSASAEPYWSNHFFDTGYGYHNMGYWGTGSWDIGSFQSNRAL